MKQPKVGIGVWVWKDGKLLMYQRYGAHGEGSWSVPGGHLEFGEAFEECAAREVLEESGIKIKNIRHLATTNDIFKDDGKHYISVWMESDWESGEPQLLEPDKCRNFGWYGIKELPEPLFLPWKELKRTRPELFR